MKIPLPALRYGSGIYLSFGASPSFGVMLSGRMFTLYKGVNDRRWHAECYDNIWRQTKTKPI